MTNFPFSLLFIIIIFFPPSLGARTYNVVSFGAKPDGRTVSTAPFLKAWASACNSAAPSSIYVPKGRFLLKGIVFKGPCKNQITFRIDGTLVAPSDYRGLGNSDSWILFSKVNKVSVVGGTLDARGASYWACKRSGKRCPVGAPVCYTIEFENKNFQILSFDVFFFSWVVEDCWEEFYLC